MMRRSTHWLYILLVIAVTLLIQGRIVFNDFTGWDDPQTITANPLLNPATAAGVRHYWSHAEAGLYVPVSYTAWGALAAIARDDNGTWRAWPFHLASLIAHGIAAGMVFLILRRLLARDAPACIGAIVFAIHPLQVESVAWASGLKDVLAGLFALLAIQQYLLFASNAARRRLHYAIALFCFALAMLSKPSAASAILIASVIDLSILRRRPRAVLASLAPWMIVLAPLLVVARIAQDTDHIPWIPLGRRFLIASDALAFYLNKLAAPLNLGLDYGRNPQWVINSGAAGITWILPPIAAALIALTRARWLVAAGVVFVCGMLMNLGFAPFQFQYYSTVADHYVYLSMFGVAMAVGWLVSRRPTFAVHGACAVILAALAILTFRQAGLWRDSFALFSHAVAVNPDSVPSHNNLGRALGEAGDLDASADQFQQSLRISPTDATANRNLALISIKRNEPDAAIGFLSESIRLNQRSGDDVTADRQELVRLLASRSRWREVIDELRIAQSHDPANPNIARMLQIANDQLAATTTTAPTAP